ncbi:MAG: glycosyltransferase family 9 protein [Candidatus Eisenbacteria bacterium]|nr:glycosyltransferase family 9 protein [Candidatus Eisenbacteria bacterium]
MTPRRREPPAGGFRRIAVLRLSSLGDVVLALPVVHALRRAWPGARLEFWVKEEYADVVRFDPALDHVRALERDARRLEDLVSMSAELEDCDLIVDLHGSARTRLLTFRQRARVLRASSYRVRRSRWVHARWTRPAPVPHALERYARALAPLGIATAGPPRVHAGAEAEAWAEAFLSAWAPGRPPVALCPGARHATKRWPEEHWTALHDALAARGLPVLLLSLESERRALPALDARAEGVAGTRWCTAALPHLAALLSRSAAAVTHDSGLMHLAAARGLEVVALFGSTAPELGFAPAGEGHRVLCRRERCQPCTLHGRPVCPRGHFRCMRELRPEAVAEAVATLAG